MERLQHPISCQCCAQEAKGHRPHRACHRGSNPDWPAASGRKPADSPSIPGSRDARGRKRPQPQPRSAWRRECSASTADRSGPAGQESRQVHALPISHHCKHCRCAAMLGMYRGLPQTIAQSYLAAHVWGGRGQALAAQWVLPISMFKVTQRFPHLVQLAHQVSPCTSQSLQGHVLHRSQASAASVW